MEARNDNEETLRNDSGGENTEEETAEARKEREMRRERLSKRMSYVLRYAALKEGLQVDGSGFVNLRDLMALPLMSQYTEGEIMEEIRSSQSHRGSSRFDCRTEIGKTLVRAAYGRRLEKNPCHEGSSVFTLFETSMQTVIGHLEDYDLQDFPDEYIIASMLSRLKRQKKLSNRLLKVLLVPALEHLDLEDINLTQNTLRLIYQQCPHLKTLSLRNCSYIVTDNMLSQLTKKLPNLEFLNLTGCSHLTDQCVKPLIKNLSRLKRVGLSFNKGITETAVIEFLQKAPALKHLDIFGLRTTAEGKEEIDRLRTERGIVVILKGLEEKDETGAVTHIKPTYPNGMMI
ncbi:hypothetical protein BaRGS_00014667 [Batillaria attramentaria]|uniref:2'-phosphotransferase n=1 Tax=Batillaria attramentaria TaxID=370345 RepID=A0ABD0L392_9CAEN